ncbi:tRNA glutamyl-Q(34) synthetase GluQRS [Ahniella affigens]|uniref:Glutamyl-Q tRNA(Asp) synthetase n=1 Tax=Ahniella affigens TaxID=2021234 RepID=A0A2P1PTE1_9GAMM|nr:tRNA glutamyl-Q(34) synthetase GluQRS [Ahniella affigens]AVP98106.1 tRNA glutamyl-Q(34) synthetase GluQRS [Ahniella affigens]
MNNSLKDSEYRGRFAPSPSGPLHFGSLVAALGSYLTARAAGGRWLIRIEDIDPLREQPGASLAFLDTLSAFGMQSDEPVWFQSRRLAHYRQALEQLIASGHAYSCMCSRAQLQAFGGIHPAVCPDGSDGDRPRSWRLRVESAGSIVTDDRRSGAFSQSLADTVGDFVIWRSDDWPAYQLAVVVDDAAQGITEVVRGADLLDSTPRQIWLQRCLGFPQPGYLHLPLAVDAEGRKLSKSDAARPIDATNPLPSLRAALAFLGQDAVMADQPDAFLAEAVAQFDDKRIPATNTRLIAGLNPISR